MLPIAWVTADAAYGQEWHFRRMLEEAGVGYVLAVPKSQQVKSPVGSWRIDHVLSGAPVDAWERISCGNGAQGPRVYDWAAAKLPAIDGRAPTHYRWVLARRSLARPEEIAYYLAFAPTQTQATVTELVRVAGTRWPSRSASRPGRTSAAWTSTKRYVGWYRHITLAMLAHAFLSAMTAHALERGEAETVRSASFPSPWQKSDGSWTLPVLPQSGTSRPSVGSAGPTGAVATRQSPATAALVCTVPGPSCPAPSPRRRNSWAGDHRTRPAARYRPGYLPPFAKAPPLGCTVSPGCVSARRVATTSTSLTSASPSG